jgi:hypothetical protein
MRTVYTVSFENIVQIQKWCVANEITWSRSNVEGPSSNEGSRRLFQPPRHLPTSRQLEGPLKVSDGHGDGSVRQ